MARVIWNENSVIDYLDLLIELNTLQDKKDNIVSFNKYEWNQLLMLNNHNYNNCNAVISIHPNDKSLTYKDITVYYDGSEDTDSISYLQTIQAWRDEIGNIRARLENREQQLDQYTSGVTAVRHGSTTNRRLVTGQLNTPVYHPAPREWRETATAADFS